mmetsp:Transcript_70091/g.197708  ORF Transcript_70091/g.197708 Transcript_70091/m.197708 type:complete len:200 (+) Transcript_70091:79-678(+)
MALTSPQALFNVKTPHIENSSKPRCPACLTPPSSSSPAARRHCRHCTVGRACFGKRALPPSWSRSSASPSRGARCAPSAGRRRPRSSSSGRGTSSRPCARRRRRKRRQDPRGCCTCRPARPRSRGARPRPRGSPPGARRGTAPPPPSTPRRGAAGSTSTRHAPRRPGCPRPRPPAPRRGSSCRRRGTRRSCSGASGRSR